MSTQQSIDLKSLGKPDYATIISATSEVTDQGIEITMVVERKTLGPTVEDDVKFVIPEDALPTGIMMVNKGVSVWRLNGQQNGSPAHWDEI